MLPYKLYAHAGTQLTRQRYKNCSGGKVRYYDLPFLLCVSKLCSFKYENVFGSSSLQDMECKAPLRLDSFLWIASCTKLMTSIAALQLVERGHFNLDDDMGQFLPELADPQILTGFVDEKPQLIKAKNKVTLRHLLTHSSGLCYDPLHPLLVRWRTFHKQGLNVGDTIIQAYGVPLIYEPGTAWSYGPGLDLVGLIIQRVSNMSLEEYLEKNIWQVLGIADMTFHPRLHEDLRTRMADMSTRDPSNGKTMYMEQWWKEDGPPESGGAGMYSTAPEFFKVVQAVLRQDARVLKRSTFEEMFRPQLNDESRASLMQDISPPGTGGPLVGLPGHLKKDYGLAGLIQTEDLPGSRRKGTLTWEGMPNLTWVSVRSNANTGFADDNEQFVDRETDLCGLYASQLFPPGDVQSLEMKELFEKTMYTRAKQGAAEMKT
ncbi:MAG: hypothetical protein Q9182_002164 [Xanthomendoza sp. 2 TL-2023]